KLSSAFDRFCISVSLSTGGSFSDRKCCTAVANISAQHLDGPTAGRVVIKGNGSGRQGGLSGDPSFRGRATAHCTGEGVDNVAKAAFSRRADWEPGRFDRG